MAMPDSRIDRQEERAAPGQAPDAAAGMEWIAGGTFLMGSDAHYAEERPAHPVTVDGFWIDRHEVTNEQFAAFVADTGHVTLAEKAPDPADYPGAKPELLRPASVVFERPARRLDVQDPYYWWRYVLDANWRQPRGPKVGQACAPDHPVVHVAYEDAAAYARWAGKELPTEAEWEFAARGGVYGGEYAWGDELMPGGRAMANTWQGSFPLENLLVDGYDRTSPVGAFPANGYGLYDMIGNVWEWTSDWYGEHPAEPAVNPRGATLDLSIDPRMPEIRVPRKVVKGGSYLCSANYDLRSRPPARMAQPIDISTCHVGFRCVVRPPPAASR